MSKLFIAVALIAFSGVSAEALKFEGVQDGDIIYIIQVRRSQTKELLYTKRILADEDQVVDFNLKNHLVREGDLAIYLPNHGGERINCYSVKNMTADFINHIDESNKVLTVDLDKESCSIKNRILKQILISKPPERRP